MTDKMAIDEAVEKNGEQFRTIREGMATILVPQSAKIESSRGQEQDGVQQVFYNPIQQYNRDLSVLAIKTYGEDALAKRIGKIKSKENRKRKRDANDDGSEPGRIEELPLDRQTTDESKELSKELEDATTKLHKPAFKILDALSASGLRALRYAHEIPFVTSVKANDLSKSAAESIKSNVSHNGLENIITVTNEDALAHMYRAIADGLSKTDRHGNPGKGNKFDVIDLDPYGTAAPFFDAAVQAVRDDGGLLCITCTDSAVWAGHSYCEKAFSLYGGTPIKGSHSHEAGLRLILNAIATSAGRYGLAVEPLLSLSIDFYTKVFVRVTKSAQAVKFLGAKSMVVYSCDHGCGAWETQHLMRSKPTPNKKGSGSFYKHSMALGPTADRLCQHCGTKMHLNGPMYGGHIHSVDFVQKLLDQIPNALPEVYGTLPRLEGMLRNVLEEMLPTPPADESVDPKEAESAAIDNHPFYVSPGRLASVVSCATPNDDYFRGALIHLGYHVGRSHCRPGSIKTDAPWSTIWWIMTEWIRQKSPVKTSKFKPSMPAWKILHDAGIIGANDPLTTVESPNKNGNSVQGSESQPAGGDSKTHNDPTSAHAAQMVSSNEAELRKTLKFDEDLARLGRHRETQKFVRYQMNPLPNWGPMSKAKPQ